MRPAASSAFPLGQYDWLISRPKARERMPDLIPCHMQNLPATGEVLHTFFAAITINDARAAHEISAGIVDQV
jgi:hypothetical protein